jgi:hypothetical protein
MGSSNQSLREVDVLICTLGLLASVSVSDLSHIRTISIVAKLIGQALDWANLWASSCIYYNCRDLPEATTHNAIYQHMSDRPIMAGTSSTNSLIYVLDGHLQPVPIG